MESGERGGLWLNLCGVHLDRPFIFPPAPPPFHTHGSRFISKRPLPPFSRNKSQKHKKSIKMIHVHVGFLRTVMVGVVFFIGHGILGTSAFFTVQTKERWTHFFKPLSCLSSHRAHFSLSIEHDSTPPQTVSSQSNQ